MENPVFKLEKVVRSRGQDPQDFEGPLDLILFLLGKNKMEIQDISISLICDQYLLWLEQRRQMDLETASEFVAMASHLVYLKTKMLLPREEETHHEMEALIQSLEEQRRKERYSCIKQLMKQLEPLSEFGRNIVTRDPEPMERGKVFEYHHKASDLLRAVMEMRNRTERALPPPKTAFQELVQHEPYPVESKAKEILKRLTVESVIPFLQLFRGNRSRSEVVATFLAVLELCRAHVLQISGSETDCTVQRTDELPDFKEKPSWNPEE